MRKVEWDAFYARFAADNIRAPAAASSLLIFIAVDCSPLLVANLLAETLSGKSGRNSKSCARMRRIHYRKRQR